MNNFQEKVDLIWDLADLLRGDYKRHEYADVILPLVVLRRLDLAMAGKRAAVRDAYAKYRGKLEKLDSVLSGVSGSLVYNYSEFDWQRLLDAPNDLSQNLVAYFNGFSPEVQDIIEKFDFRRQVSRLHASNLLYSLLKKFVDKDKPIDLHPDSVQNHEMGYIFEELIRKFSEQYNETAGEHFTPREVIALMVQLLLSENQADFIRPGKIIEIFDPACGTGGMLTESKKAIEKLSEDFNPKPQVYLFGQELNPTSFAVAKADLLLKGEDPRKLAFGNSFSEDGHAQGRFRLMLSNPPFGVEWKKVEYIIRNEYESKGEDGRFGAGLPRITDGSLLFLQHMLSKRMDEAPGSRVAIIFNGSPLFTGDAGSGESEIRRWIIEQDWLEGIVALPDQLFYNTGINTYIWIVTNRKNKQRKGKVQLVNAADFWEEMKPRSLGNKRHRISDAQRAEIVEIYRAFRSGEYCRIFENADLGYRRIRVERPLRLNFSATAERIERVKEQPAFKALTESKKQDKKAKAADRAAGEKLQGDILAALRQLPPNVLRDPAQYQPLLDKALKPLKLKDPLRKAILQAITERDETAQPVPAGKKSGAGAKHPYEPDTELRDYENVPLNGRLALAPSIYDENVPLKDDVFSYFKREVLPYVPDAWVDEGYCDAHDEKVGVVGYEINFNRYFYKYEPPPAPETLEAQIAALEADIAALLKTRA